MDLIFPPVIHLSDSFLLIYFLRAKMCWEVRFGNILVLSGRKGERVLILHRSRDLVCIHQH